MVYFLSKKDPVYPTSFIIFEIIDEAGTLTTRILRTKSSFTLFKGCIFHIAVV
jgi:hypothetical protein